MRNLCEMSLDKALKGEYMEDKEIKVIPPDDKIISFVKCRICGKEMHPRTLKSHLPSKHKIKYKDYIKEDSDASNSM